MVSNGRPKQIMNQDSSKNFPNPSAFVKGKQQKNLGPIPPLQVKFQELNPTKRDSLAHVMPKQSSPRNYKN